MAKENKSKLIIWALVALVLGVILGLIITNITATGQAKSALGLDSGKQEANLQEARQDLVLNLLKVNRIDDRLGGLRIDTQGSTRITAKNSINLEAGSSTDLGISVIGLEPGTIENPSETSIWGDEIILRFGLLTLSNKYNLDVPALEINGGPNWQDVSVNAPLKYNVAMDVNYGTDNYYACIAGDGTIFKSYAPCN